MTIRHNSTLETFMFQRDPSLNFTLFIASRATYHSLPAHVFEAPLPTPVLLPAEVFSFLPGLL